MAADAGWYIMRILDRRPEWGVLGEDSCTWFHITPRRRGLGVNLHVQEVAGRWRHLGHAITVDDAVVILDAELAAHEEVLSRIWKWQLAASFKAKQDAERT